VTTDRFPFYSVRFGRGGEIERGAEAHSPGAMPQDWIGPDRGLTSP
jgi:hypothetical protein